MFRQAKGEGIFYGWFVVAACFVVTATLGETFYSFGVFFKPLEEEFGWSRGLISSGSTAFVIGYSISVAVSGRLADRYSPRFILLPSATLAGLGIALCSQLSSIDQLRLFLLIAGLGSGATLSVPTSVVQRWFRYRRSAGTALAVVSAGIGVGQLAFTSLINAFILSYGWRNAYLIAGAIIFVSIFISTLVIRKSPAEAQTGLPSRETTKSVSAQGWDTAKAMSTLAYVGIVYCVCVALVANQTVVVHLVPHATDLGMSSIAAAAALGLLGGLSIAGRLASGFISSKIGWQKTLALSLFGIVASMTWLLFLDTAWMIYGFVFLFGIFMGIRAVTMLGILGEFFGFRSLGALIGVTAAVSGLVGAAAPYITGLIFDSTGSYFMAFAIITILVVSGGLVAILIKKPLVTPN